MACSPIFGTHGIRASQVLHDHLLLTSRIMSSMDVKMAAGTTFYGLWLSHQTFQVPNMEDVYNI